MIKVIETASYRLCYGSKFSSKIVDGIPTGSSIEGVYIDKLGYNTMDERTWYPITDITVEQYKEILEQVVYEQMQRDNKLLQDSNLHPKNQEERDLFLNKIPKIKAFL